MDEQEQRIRELAHQIWEQEGRPHGRDQQHWNMASDLVKQEENRRQAAKSKHAGSETLMDADEDDEALAAAPGSASGFAEETGNGVPIARKAPAKRGRNARSKH